MTSRLVSSGVAAAELGVERGTLARWVQRGLVTPALVTAGGQYRWDLDDLKRQLRERAEELRRAADEDD